MREYLHVILIVMGTALVSTAGKSKPGAASSNMGVGFLVGVDPPSFQPYFDVQAGWAGIRGFGPDWQQLSHSVAPLLP